MREGEPPPSFTMADSPVESTRFGRRVRRYELSGEDAGPLLDSLRADPPDLAIVRIPTRRGELITQFGALGGELVLGDCRVIYRRDNLAAGLPGGAADPAFRLRAAVPTDGPLLDAMVEQIFAGYHTHYVSTPRLAGFPLADGYKEWTRAHVGGRDNRCWIAELAGVPCAFTTAHVTAGEGEVVLNGVLPAFRGQGVYRALLRATIGAFMEAGAPTTVIATQIDNRAVQRVWVTEGFALAKSEYTLHINFDA